MKRSILTFFITGLFLSLFLFSFLPLEKSYDTAYELLREDQGMLGDDTIIIDSSKLFVPSTNCAGCHGYDPLEYASVDAEGNDVNVMDDWRASMMANSSKDPYWRAKVSQELLRHGQYSEVIEDKCTSCHAPMANYQSKLDGDQYYPFHKIFDDSLAIDGVSCGACHQISPEDIGTTFSGKIHYDTNRVIYGPYTIPFGAPMEEFVGFDPVFSEHIFESEVCASCHTLVTTAIDEDGNLTNTSFVEQATYHEWLNSSYSQDGTNCQTCHMEYILDPVIISTGYIFLSGRKPFALHRFQGANTHMMSLIKNFKDSLGLNIPDSIFQEQIDATLNFLQTKAVELNVEEIYVDNDSLVLEVFIKNKSGHKFPSGYPSRRAFLEVVVSSTEHDTLFHSGKMREDYRLEQIEGHYEQHYDFIKNEDQVQVYELVPGDENGEFTTILLRAFSPLKDNRLVPKGFSIAHSVYDTTLLAGEVLNDPNFNWENNAEGSGTDRIIYKIGLDGYDGLANISCRLRYQSVPPEWVDELFADEHELIQHFEHMYNTVKPVPVDVASVRIDSFSLAPSSAVSQNSSPIIFFPNPVHSGGQVSLNYSKDIKPDQTVHVFDMNGKWLSHINIQDGKFKVAMPSGIYILVFETESKRFVEKIIVH